MRKFPYYSTLLDCYFSTNSTPYFMMPKQVFLIFFLFCAVFSVASAQTTPDTPAFFEGSLEYKVGIEGEAKDMILENKPNNLMTLHLKDGNYMVSLDGGMYPKTFMFLADSSYEYSIDMKNKRAFRVSTFNHYKPMWMRPPATATGKLDKIKVKVGKVEQVVDCQVFEIKTDSSYTQLWVSDKYVANTSFYKEQKRAQANFLIQGLEGKIPLKIVKKEKGLITTITISIISPRKFDPKQFTIPDDFSILRRDRRW
jgi:Domain of unknown function (DUF4412)